MKDDLRCDACNVIVESSTHMDAHLSGKKHQIKMKAYLDRVNAGAIAPPMSSRGFCDFNNVEREEANPVDPSRFVQECILPKNLTGSFLDRFKEEDTQNYQDTFIEADYGMHDPMNSGFEPRYDEEFQPMRSMNFMDDMQPDINRGFGGMPEDSSMYFMDHSMPNPPWSNSISRSQLDSPYAPNLPNRMGSKFPVPSFGPTKFKYSRKQPL